LFKFSGITVSKSRRSNGTQYSQKKEEGLAAKTRSAAAKAKAVQIKKVSFFGPLNIP
jgi:hypothetical protein